MSRMIEIITPEQVAIRYELAGFGTRALAALWDSLLQLGLLFVLALIFVLAFGGADELYSGEKFAASFIIGIFTLVVFLVVWGYHILFETVWNGQTPGKRLMRLRVIADSGHPVDFRAVVIRNLMRVVDILPGVPPIVPLYGMALITVLCNDHYKRLGDIAAGTIVVRHGQEEDDKRQFGFGEAVVFRLLDAQSLTRISLLTREEHRLVASFLEKRSSLPLPLRAEFARRLALPFTDKMGYNIPQLGMDYERWLDEISLAYQSHSIGLSPEPQSHLREQNPVPSPAPQQTNDDERKW